MWKYTQEEIEELFAQRGYTVLGQYVNSCTPVEYRCAKGHVHAMSWSNLKFGKRCPTCSRQAVSERQRYSYAYVKEYFHANGCRLLSREYRNANTPLAYRCNCGNVSKVTFHHFNHGTRCNKCATARKVQAMQANGRVLTSAQQLHIQKLIGGEQNYPVSTASQDIAFPEKMIYVEYDGSGHDLNVKKGNASQVEFDRRQTRRSYALYRRGWKCIRIISKKDQLPSDEMISTLIEDSIEVLLRGRSIVTIDIDQRRITHSELTVDADFGELRRLKRS